MKPHLMVINTVAEPPITEKKQFTHQAREIIFSRFPNHSLPPGQKVILILVCRQDLFSAYMDRRNGQDENHQ
ncbi:MAG: hypothetical protein WC560_01600 [Syntrophales bacterium]